MPLGTEVGLSPGGIVLDGEWTQLPHRKGHSRPHFSAHFALAGSTISATAELLFVEATTLILLKINSPLNFKAPPPRAI